jgi:hypothetical protein
LFRFNLLLLHGFLEAVLVGDVRFLRFGGAFLQTLFNDFLGGLIGAYWTGHGLVSRVDSLATLSNWFKTWIRTAYPEGAVSMRKVA